MLVEDGHVPSGNYLREQLITRCLGISRRFRRKWIRLNRRRDYARWQVRNEPDPDERARQRNLALALETPVTFLLCMVGAEINHEPMRQTLRHLQAQTWPWWQLRVFVEPESIHQIQAAFQGADALDKRVSVLPLGGESGEGVQKNSADLADILLQLEPGDCLAPAALWDVVKFLDASPAADMVYADEDQCDSRGARHSPWFKPDWSPELFYSVDYLRPLFIRSQSLVPGASGPLWRDGKLDLPSLWESAILGKAHVGHLPKVLLHRPAPMGEESQNHSAGQQMHARWVEGHFRKLGKTSVNVTQPTAHGLQISWATDHPLVSIIIPSKNRSVLERCTRSLTQITRYPRYEIIVLDSGKPGITHDFSARYAPGGIPMRAIPAETPFNYSRTNNEGAAAATGEILLFLNDDTEIIAGGWLEEMVRWAELPEIGAVGGKLLYRDATIQHAGVILGMGGHAHHVFTGAEEDDDGPYGCTLWYRNFLAVTGACMMVRREVFDSVGGFNEDFELAFGDIDLCLRIIEKGLRIMVTPFARLIHREGASRGRYMPVQDLILAGHAFLPWIKAGDPYFNANLSYASPYPRVIGGEEDRVGRLEKIVNLAQTRKA